MAESREFFDAHAHMSFAPDVASFASWFTERFAGAFSTTVSPADYRFAQQALASFPKIKVGVGAHPWWVAQGKISDEDKALLPDLVASARYIGEVGLDFGKNGLAKSVFATDEQAKQAQIEVLRMIFAAAKKSPAPSVVEGIEGAKEAEGVGEAKGGRVFSFHAVRGADVIMDMLEEYELLEDNTIIFHWFSGSSAQLKRARDLGCFFSVNAFMLQTKRGREYAKAIPLDRLLIETDLPEETPIDACVENSQACKQATEAVEMRYISMLEEAYREIVALRGEDALDAITRNVRKIFY